MNLIKDLNEYLIKQAPHLSPKSERSGKLTVGTEKRTNEQAIKRKTDERKKKRN